ncbi:MAG TPA: ThuA domain-containing protein [Chitinophagaceae bacterium]|nr:ThuA domain-containing protein [Chitinophagaceae bacterium]
MKYLFVFIICFYSLTVNAQLKNKHVLIFTKNGKGYIHENIPSSIAAIQKLGIENGFKADTTTNSGYFTDGNLKKYDVIIFSNTNNDVFDTEEQKVAFMRYIQAGGGYMGIHSATGTERNWKWFKLMMGATFLRHPPFQHFTVHVLDKKHPAVKNLSHKWETNDECYYFKEINPSIKVLLVSDLSTIKEADSVKNIKPDIFGNWYPAAWCQEFDGGRIWYTALGHSKEDYSSSTYLAHLLEGLKWVTDKPKPDYKKAKATSTVVDEMKIF